MEVLMSTKSKKHDPRFEELLRNTTSVDETGNVKIKGMYASTYINFGFDGGIVSVPVSHVVWFVTRGRWPDEGKNIDHCDDDSMNNAPDNLAEVTHTENQHKRRNRIVSRAYGKGKYGHGIGVRLDKRDGRYYVTRNLSRGHHKERKTVKISLGGFKTILEAEARVTAYLAEISA
jgi:hypothetical protein